MKIRLARAIGTITPNLKEKIRGINNFQSERTAREFTEEIENMFRIAELETKAPFFGQRGYFLQIFNPFESALVELMIQKERSRSMAGYLNVNPWTGEENEPSIKVESQTAYLLPSQKKEILLGRTNPLEYIPVGMVLGETSYPLIKGQQYIPQSRIKFS